jgi:acyl-CoA thioester hydrolase
MSATPDLPVGFHWELEPAEADIDELQHVSNLVYVRWVQEVAVQHSSAVGFDWPGYQRLGAVFVVRKHELEYLAPLRRGERVRVSTWVAGWRGPSADRRTSVVRLSDGREVMRGTTHWVLVSIADGRPRRIPPELCQAFGVPYSPRGGEVARDG